MSSDAGMMGRIEDWFISRLAALEYEGELVFEKTVNQQKQVNVDHWKHQIASGEAGIESFDRYAPFAFVKWQPWGTVDREGDYDLNQKIRIAVAIGQTSKHRGAARFGGDRVIGTSLMHSLVINLFEGKHPGADFTCDDFYYKGDEESVDHPNRHGIEMYFEANYLTIQS